LISLELPVALPWWLECIALLASMMVIIMKVVMAMILAMTIQLMMTTRLPGVVGVVDPGPNNLNN
jgi:hypothetical protein